ncbi:GlsB/YeaQ/YmgE family stress response membrane protein [Caenimonas aquaedulcis]|uniref:GlsB/YeaQ/YmgE family stress response membrane protein n=1 Tax=Caenimonas aquaedulcis TaxID=2793270 RepID=A0A931H826_9BURK|nr:GlsB/YeaQ/YmgE family stress response membrane protein [Caenimonas aquaedulcis]MBG9390147.1 GlsB/YeaQ/YmgE family stress response membrane protein [Caenimonas aquaedulcis]
MKRHGRGALIENVLVGVFGAFLGGDFLVSMLHGGVVNDKDFHASSLGFAVVGAVVMVALLSVMRGKVGTLKQSKGKQRDR